MRVLAVLPLYNQETVRLCVATSYVTNFYQHLPDSYVELVVVNIKTGVPHHIATRAEMVM